MVVWFTRVRPRGRWVHPGSLRLLRFALGRRVNPGSLGSQGFALGWLGSSRVVGFP